MGKSNKTSENKAQTLKKNQSTQKRDKKKNLESSEKIKAKNQLVVSKFGGTSMNDAACMLKSAQVACQQKASIVVVSATSGTTNDLINLGQTAEKKSWEESQILLNKIINRHIKISTDLKIDKKNQEALKQLFEQLASLSQGIYLLRDCSLKAMDTLMSFGEILSSRLFTLALNKVLKEEGKPYLGQFFDAREVIITDDHYSKARPNLEIIQQKAQSKLMKLLKDRVLVTQGFIGMSEDGITTTLGRGGSDYSAALFAEAIQADVLEIWTDVSGISTTDPRLCSQAKMIEEISFKEASELATFGAKVLHPSTVIPAMRKNIPVLVASTFQPEKGGTWIRRSVDEYPLIRALALRKKQVLLTLSTPEMLHSHGFLFEIFKVFNLHKVSIDAITTSEISVSLTLDDTTLINKQLLKDLSRFAEVVVEENLCLVSIIGNHINHTPGLSKKIFSAISDINVRMICMGASKHNFCFLVEEKNGAEVIERLHKTFIE